MKKSTLAAGMVVLLSFILLPYVLADWLAGPETVFAGFLQNPLDGHSYLAKMSLGAHGSWLFYLPYTPDPGEGTLLFVFYLFLGQMAGWLSLQPIWVFHGARLLASAWMTWQLFALAERSFENPRTARFAFWLALVGSGMGWLSVAFLPLTMDLWVAEAYPFLSAYLNPHFPLALGLLLWLLRRLHLEQNAPPVWQQGLVGALLALVLPFGIVVYAVIAAGWLAWQYIEQRRMNIGRYATAIIAGGILAAFQYWQTIQHPVLAQWNEQNLTPSPPLWSLLIGLSPALLLAVPGVWAAWKDRRGPQKLLLLWFFLALLLVFAPFNLQRRFFFGFYIPTAFLCTWGLFMLIELRRGLNWLLPAILMLSLPSNLLLIAIEVGAAGRQSSELVMYPGEVQAFEWIRENTQPDSILLAAPDTGLLIPSQTGRRVLYGHPFESAPADELLAAVNAYYQQGILPDQPVDYIFWGPRERQRSVQLDPACDPVYRNSSVLICSGRAP